MGEGSAVNMYKRILSSGCAQDEPNRPVAVKKSSEGEALLHRSMQINPSLEIKQCVTLNLGLHAV